MVASSWPTGNSLCMLWILLCCHACAPGVLTGAGHGRRVRFRAEVSFVTNAGRGSLPDGVAVERTLGAGAVGRQSTVVTNLTGWRNEAEEERFG